jgi:hypothetical protein
LSLIRQGGYRLGKRTKGDPSLWEAIERTAHADKARLKERAAAAAGCDAAGQAGMLVERLQASAGPAATK